MLLLLDQHNSIGDSHPVMAHGRNIQHCTGTMHAHLNTMRLQLLASDLDNTCIMHTVCNHDCSSTTSFEFYYRMLLNFHFFFLTVTINYITITCTCSDPRTTTIKSLSLYNNYYSVCTRDGLCCSR